jgi:hypothetical protein
LTATTSGNPIGGTISDVYFGCIGNQRDLVVLPSSLTVVVKGQKTEGGSTQVLLSKSITTNQITIPKGSTSQKTVGFVSFYGKDIETAINPTKDFTNYLEFAVSGNIKIAYKGYEGYYYTFPISTSKIPVQYSAKVDVGFKPITTPIKTTDQDGDGIIDVYDSCPYQKETFNGYQDTDGCPDTTTTQPNTGTDTPPVTPTTCPSGQIWIKDHCETNSIGLKHGKMTLKYSVILEDDILTNDVTKYPYTTVSFAPLQFVKFGKEQKRFMESTFEPVMKLEDGSSSDYSPSTANFRYTGTVILPNLQEITVQGFGIPSTNKVTRDSSGYYHFPAVKLTYDMIERSLRDNSKISQTEATPINFNVGISGDFDLIKVSDGKKVRGTLKTMGLSYLMTYDPTKPYDPKEPCQGLSGEEQIECRQKVDNPNECPSGFIAVPVGSFGSHVDYECVDPKSTGGECKNLTSQQCLDKAGNKGCTNLLGLNVCLPSPPPITVPDSSVGGSSESPETKPTTVGLCEAGQSFDSCISSILPLSTTDGLPFDMTTLGLLLLLIIIIIIVIIAMKRRNRYA